MQIGSRINLRCRLQMRNDKRQGKSVCETGWDKQQMTKKDLKPVVWNKRERAREN